MNRSDGTSANITEPRILGDQALDDVLSLVT